MCRQKYRINFARFKARIATPGNLVSGFQLPGSGNFFVSSSSLLAVSTALLSAGSRTLSAPAGASNKLHPIGYFEKGKTVSKAGGAPGIVKLYVRNGMGKALEIGQG